MNIINNLHRFGMSERPDAKAAFPGCLCSIGKGTRKKALFEVPQLRGIKVPVKPDKSRLVNESAPFSLYHRNGPFYVMKKAALRRQCRFFLISRRCPIPFP